MGEYRFSIHVAAPPDQVFDLWVKVAAKARAATTNVDSPAAQTPPS